MAINGENVEITRVPLNKIKISRNSRISVSEEELDGLMQSIKEVGLLQPIGLVKRGSAYEIAFGNRRFLACSKLGLARIPAIVREEKREFDVDIQNLTENIQRRNLGLAEIGRYISILQKEGLSSKECAVRLGVTPKYVESCLTAFERVPPKYRDDIEVRVSPHKTGEHTAPGKISISQATAIENAGRTYSLGVEQRDVLYKAAKKHGSKFRPEQITKYAAAVKAGKDPMETVPEVRSVHMHILLSEKEYERLRTKYIDDGPLASMSALLRALLSGKIHERIKLIEEGPKL
jgi:ParB/RepB/Spo0J family partition protein